MNRNDFIEKFKGFFTLSDEAKGNEVTHVEPMTDSEVSMWLPSPDEGFVVKTSLIDHVDVGMAKEEMVAGNWDHKMKALASNLTFVPHKDGLLKLVNVNPAIEMATFSKSGWHITSWELVAYDPKEKTYKSSPDDRVEKGDLICSRIVWENHDPMQAPVISMYGWPMYLD